MSLEERMEALATAIVAREERHAEDLTRAQDKAKELHARVSGAVERFNGAVAQNAPGLQLRVNAPRLDDKHAHAVQFDLERGRHRAIVTVKSKAEVTLVGPFKAGKPEGPCRTFPFAATEDLDDALGDFLERFVEERGTLIRKRPSHERRRSTSFECVEDFPAPSLERALRGEVRVGTENRAKLGAVRGAFGCFAEEDRVS